MNWYKVEAFKGRAGVPCFQNLLSATTPKEAAESLMFLLKARFHGAELDITRIVVTPAVTPTTFNVKDGKIEEVK